MNMPQNRRSSAGSGSPPASAHPEPTDLAEIERASLARVGEAQSLDDIAKVRAELLGKKGSLSALMRTLAELPPEERPLAGQKINQVKAKIEGALDEKKAVIEQRHLDAELSRSQIDVTLPGRRVFPGAAHPLRQVEADIIRSLASLGFEVVDGPHVETDWYNFEALNFPPDHPARDMQDTFFCADKVLLRTHTSNVQIRTMTRRKPPVRIISLGMVFRHDEVDPSHSPVFHQVEGLWIDERASFADLKGVLRKMVGDLFGGESRLRFRPSFFPFTEPSAEVDMQCFACGGGGKVSADGGSRCSVCKGSGWIEILGSGMVDPAVLEAVGYNPDQVQGFAFGAGIERIAMLRWGISDIRLFYENDLRFLQQFTPRIEGA